MGLERCEAMSERHSWFDLCDGGRQGPRHLSPAHEMQASDVKRLLLCLSEFVWSGKACYRCWTLSKLHVALQIPKSGLSSQSLTMETTAMRFDHHITFAQQIESSATGDCQKAFPHGPIPAL